jgi:acyl-CoA thioester hydrolase
LEKLFNTRLTIKIDWADLDLFGHVNNVVFFKYIQSARVNYCELIGLTSLDERDKLSFMVASSQCQFKKPLHYPGEICVRVRVDWIKNTCFQLVYRLEKNNELIAEAQDVIVVFNHLVKTKVLVSEGIRKAISEREMHLF